MKKHNAKIISYICVLSFNITSFKILKVGCFKLPLGLKEALPAALTITGYLGDMLITVCLRVGILSFMFLSCNQTEDPFITVLHLTNMFAFHIHCTKLINRHFINCELLTYNSVYSMQNVVSK